MLKKNELTKKEAYRGFAVASLAHVVIFMSISSPIPLYGVYQENFGMTNSDFAYTMLVYIIGVIFPLAFLGRISDAIGRKNAALIGIALAIAGALAFALASSTQSVLAARAVQGFAGAFSMSSVCTLVVDSISKYKLGWASLVISCGSLLGIVIGSIMSGNVYAVTGSMNAVYMIDAICLTASAVLVATLAKEPLASRKRFSQVVIPKLLVPKGSTILFVVICLVFGASWNIGNFYQSYTPAVVLEYFHSDSTVASSVVLASIMAPSILAGPLTLRIQPMVAIKIGVIMLASSAVVLLICMHYGSLPIFIVATCFASFSLGTCLTNSMRVMLLSVEDVQTSFIIASVNLVAYVETGLVSFVSSMFVNQTSPLAVFAFTGAICLVAALAVFTVNPAGSRS